MGLTNQCAFYSKDAIFGEKEREPHQRQILSEVTSNLINA